jgi:hypothetical protein
MLPNMTLLRDSASTCLSRQRHYLPTRREPLLTQRCEARGPTVRLARHSVTGEGRAGVACGAFYDAQFVRGAATVLQAHDRSNWNVT